MPLWNKAWLLTVKLFFESHCPMNAPRVYWTVSAADNNLTACCWLAGLDVGCWAERPKENVKTMNVVNKFFII
jgi:hypothetical protein